MYTKIAQLILNPEKSSVGVSDIFIAEPDKEKEELAGKLFALIEIESRNADDLKIINFIVGDLEHNYYQSEKLIMAEKFKNIKIEHVFEAAIAKTNKNLLDFLTAEKLKFNPSGLNAIVGIIQENNLHFANLGKNKAFLVYKNKVEIPSKLRKNNPLLEETRYKVINVIDQTGREGHPVPSQAKLFSSVISGDIPANGYFVFMNEALSEYLSSKQLIEIVTTLPPTSAVEQMKNILTQVNAYVPFLGIVIKNTLGIKEEIVSEKTVVTATSARQSISNLNSIEEKTEKFLSAGGDVNVKKWLNVLRSAIAGFLPGSRGSSLPLSPDLKDKMLSKKRSAFAISSKLFSFLKAVLLLVLGLVISFFTLVTNKGKILALYNSARFRLQVFINKTKVFFSGLKEVIFNLSAKNKIVISVVVVSLLVFVNSVVIKNIQNRKAIENEKTALNLKTIEQKQNQIDANLLYGNEDMVKKLLADTKELLVALPESETNSYASIVNKYSEQLEKILHVENLALSPVADFARLDPAAKPTNLTLVNDKIYSADTERKTIYSLNTTNGTISSVALSGKIQALKFPSVDKGNSIYYLNNDNLVVLNTKTDKTTNISIDSPLSINDVSAAKIFNNRLYLVNNKDNQIYRYNKGATNFNSPTQWLKEQVDLTNASALDIDGDVYVAKSNGEIYKFLMGKLEKFTFDTVEPAIGSAIGFVIGQDAKFFYAFEPAQKRVIVFDQKGKFIMQYKSDQFTDLKNFAINEKTKTLYFLNGTAVLKADAKHLK